MPALEKLRQENYRKLLTSLGCRDSISNQQKLQAKPNQQPKVSPQDMNGFGACKVESGEQYFLTDTCPCNPTMGLSLFQLETHKLLNTLRH